MLLGIDYIIKLFLRNVLVCHNEFASSIYFAVVPSCVMNVKEGRYSKRKKKILKVKSQHLKFNFKYLRVRLILVYLGNIFLEQRQYHQMQNLSKISRSWKNSTILNYYYLFLMKTCLKFTNYFLLTNQMEHVLWSEF